MLQSQKSLLLVSAVPLLAQMRLNSLLFRREARLYHCVDVTFLSPAPMYSSPSSDSIPCALHKYHSYMLSNFHCANASEYPLHITIGWRIKGKRSIRLPPFVIRTGQIYWIPRDRSGGTQNWYWFGKSGTPDVQVLLINYHVAFFNLEAFIIIQVWRVVANMCLLNKQSRAVGTGWSFGLKVWCGIFSPSS